MLTPELAEKIITEVKKFLNEDIIVVNTKGMIIASTDENRIGHFHEGAKIVLQTKEKLIITKDTQRQLQGVKQGINLPVFFQQGVIGVIGITGNPDKVSPFGEIIRKMTELLISESHYAEQSDWHLRALEGFVFDWLQEKEWDSTFHERAKLLNINLEIPRQVIIAKFSLNDEYVHRDIWNHLYAWTGKQEQDFIIRWGIDRVILLLDTSSHSLQSAARAKITEFFDYLSYLLRIPVSAGVGKVVSSSALVETFRQAERALRTAEKESKLVFDEDLTLEMILDDLSAETKSEFVTRTIGKLLPEEELIETLKELFKQNHSLKKTAESLHIHVNTLHYRMKKTQEITGLNPSNIQELFILHLALIFLEE
ncbi:CdaR family transcriptional regulator [Mesobacillus maritimus]|uniref:CdaR family transcriptional regulator n=1 Tax=Mesobacillus maritimus TaxID=1643336 RepID=UPI00384FF105